MKTVAKPQNSPPVHDVEAMMTQFRRYRETRDPALRDEIICANLPLVYTVARRYYNASEPLEDLIQEGSIGLLKAVDYFDPDRGVRFSTYACHLITSQILHYLRDCGHLIRQPAWVQELNTKISRVATRLRQALGRDAQTAEIAQELNLTTEAVEEVMAARELNRVVSLTAPNEESDDEAILLIDKAKIRQARQMSLRLPIEDRIVMEEAIEGLKKMEQRVLRLFFYGNLTLSEIASRLSISTPRSAYILRSSINKIKAGMDEHQRQETSLLLDGLELPELPVDGPIFDKMTGVHSEAYFNTRLAEECRESLVSGDEFSLAILEIRGLVGPGESTQLATLGRALSRTIHGATLTAYLQEGRFGVLVFMPTETAVEHLTQVGDAVRNEIATHLEDTLVRLAGMGMAHFPRDGQTPDRLYRRAERALAAALKGQQARRHA